MHVFLLTAIYFSEQAVFLQSQYVCKLRMPECTDKACVCMCFCVHVLNKSSYTHIMQVQGFQKTASMKEGVRAAHFPVRHKSFIMTMFRPNLGLRQVRMFKNWRPAPIFIHHAHQSPDKLCGANRSG